MLGVSVLYLAKIVHVHNAIASNPFLCCSTAEKRERVPLLSRQRTGPVEERNASCMCWHLAETAKANPESFPPFLFSVPDFFFAFRVLLSWEIERGRKNTRHLISFRVKRISHHSLQMSGQQISIEKKRRSNLVCRV